MPLTADDIIQRSKELRKPGKITSDELNYMVTSPVFLNVETNPCIVEQYYVRKCMYEQNYDAAQCEDYFQNHKDCGSFWGRVKMARFMKGEQPLLPPPDEREKIKREYIEEVKSVASLRKNA